MMFVVDIYSLVGGSCPRQLILRRVAAFGNGLSEAGAPDKRMQKSLAIGFLNGFLFLVFFLLFFTAAHAQIQPEVSSGWLDKEGVSAQYQMVSASHPDAVHVGVAILRQGGNAVDAAIAVQMMLNVVEPQSSGIGGGALMLYYDNLRHEVHAFDGRETAPQGAKPDMFLDDQGKPLPFYDAVNGGKSIGTPGLLKMLKKVHGQYGKLPWKQLFASAVEKARYGYTLSPRLRSLLDQVVYVPESKGLRSLYFDRQGNLKPVGTAIVNEPLAQSLEKIADQGPDYFYTGELGKKIVKAVKSAPHHPGTLSLNDLKAYESRERPVLCEAYRVYKICGMGPPTSGGIAVLQTLKMIEFYGQEMGKTISLPVVQVMLEALKRAFADRNFYIADSDFVPVPVQQLLDMTYLKKRAQAIRPDTDNGKAAPGQLWGVTLGESGDSYERPSTTHISIVDADGNAVSMTSSIEHAFGSGLVVEGFLLNNQLTDFSFIPESGDKLMANSVEPGKRPLSSMSPLMVFDRNDQLYMILGSPGGQRIIPYLVQVLMLVLDYGMDLQEAVNYPHIVNTNGNTEFERDKGLEVFGDSLKAMGYTVEYKDLNSGIHAIMRKGNAWVGAADPRREGMVRGD